MANWFLWRNFLTAKYPVTLYLTEVLEEVFAFSVPQYHSARTVQLYKNNNDKNKLTIQDPEIRIKMMPQSYAMQAQLRISNFEHSPANLKLA